MKFAALFDGPELNAEVENAKAVFPDKTTDDVVGLITI